jgi:hypothetical protein
MPDDETLPDERDERIAALLPVEPLDDVTRRRLVSTAMRSQGTARQARRLMAAAAVVFVLVAGAGVAIAVGGGSDTSSSTAAREQAKAALPAGDGTESFSQQARDVGDFGDLGVAANVDRLRRAFDAAGPLSVKPASPSNAASAAGQATANDQAGSDALVSRFRALGCSPSTLPPGTVVALASGTLDGHPVIVIDLESASRAHSFHAIETDTCKVHRLS